MARRRVRAALKAAYLALPLKQAVFTALRRVWTPPASMRRYLYFRGVFSVDGDRCAFRMRHYGYPVEGDIFWTGIFNGWEGCSLRLWAALAGRSRVVVDVGANTGVYALLAKATQPAARVYAFEPIERIYRKLVDNVALNRFDIDCRMQAVSNYDGRGTMFDLAGCEHPYVVALDRDVHHEGTLEQPVGVVRLETFLREEAAAPDLIKIDVESREPEVLEGLGGYLGTRRPTLLIEIWHDDEQAGVLDIARRVETVLHGKGYRYFRIDEARGAVAADHIGVPGRGYSNYLICTHEVARDIGLTTD